MDHPHIRFGAMLTSIIYYAMGQTHHLPPPLAYLIRIRLSLPSNIVINFTIDCKKEMASRKKYTNSSSHKQEISKEVKLEDISLKEEEVR